MNQLRPRVYAVGESERIGETLAILLESTCEYRWLGAHADEPHASLPPPTLVIDARVHADAERPSDASQHWPAAKTVRIDLTARPDPVAVQSEIAHALVNTSTPVPIGDAIRLATTDLAIQLKPRLVAARALLAVASREPDITRGSMWRALCREQLHAIDDRVASMSDRIG